MESKIRVRHREYICDIMNNNAGSFSILSFPINPGLPFSFPWLSGIANNYEQYRMSGLIFEFKTLLPELSANVSLGTVIMATVYDALDTQFSDKLTMANYQFANTNRPTRTFIHPVECARDKTPVSELYIRSSTPPGDLRMYDLGIFQIATSGTPAGILGELWATYEIILYKPRMTTAIGYSVLSDHWQLNNVSSTVPLGSTSILQPGSGIGTVITTGSPNVVRFPVGVSNGNFLICYSVTGTAGPSITPPAMTSVLNVSYLSYWSGDTVNNNNNTNTAAQTLFTNVIIRVNGQSPAVGFATSGVFPTTITSGDLWIVQLNSLITR